MLLSLYRYDQQYLLTYLSQSFKSRVIPGLFLSSVNIMFTEPSKPLDIHINKPILFEVKFIGEKGEFDKGLLTTLKL
jgi:hypothetical protein